MESKEFKGTKGKWCTEWRNGNHYIHKEKSKYHREYIGQIFYLKNEENTHNSESYYNALLISKAPELLEILQRVNVSLMNDSMTVEQIELREEI